MRTLIFFSFLLWQSTLNAQVRFSINLQEDGKTYLVKLKPEESYSAPRNITNTAQISLVVATGGFLPGNIQNIKGKWQNNNNIIAPKSNPKKDYLIFNLLGHIKDIDYVAGEEVELFSFENVGKPTGQPRFSNKNDSKLLLAKKLNIGNQISVLGAGFKNAYVGSYYPQKDGFLKENNELSFGNQSAGQLLPSSFGLDISVNHQGVLLNWTVLQKRNTSLFVLEKSLDGMNYESVKILKIKDNQPLETIDEAPDYGTNYYRIKQQYNNGDYRYSTVQSEQILIDKASITMYPNPVKDNLNLKIGHFADVEGQVRIFNISGMEMVKKMLATDQKQIQFNTTDYQNGIYFLIIETQSDRILERQFIVERGE